jgi:two-component system chemotaxis sensor kinase CheA
MDKINGTEKNLRSNFATVDRGRGNVFILGTLEDVTAAKELERQLAEEEGKREEEMKALFQVIQVEPRVFGDFLEDTEYEFDRINDILKNQKLSGKDAMVMIYQSVHAIKSNALILGLENFSGKLHELENKIRKLREVDDVPFEEVLHITVELESIMREKDRFRDIIGKIESFRGTGGRRQDRFVLIETLTKACEKASEALHKKTKFIVDDLDGEILEHGPRRVIKEILTQLVRNSAYHGIETPEDRRAAGKESEGSVRLVLKHVEDKINIKLSDDGRGLDFEKIRKKALSSKVLKNEEEAGDRAKLLSAIFAPGFSTAEVADLHAGRGIGLNLVRERIKDLKGTIKVQTESGKGTSFVMIIPYEPAQAVH